jgi:hypothetical protein
MERWTMNKQEIVHIGPYKILETTSTSKMDVKYPMISAGETVRIFLTLSDAEFGKFDAEKPGD